MVVFYLQASFLFVLFANVITASKPWPPGCYPKQSMCKRKVTYTCIILQPRSFITLSIFRTTNNRLPVERGRWENVDRSQRFCNLRTGNMLDDEFHYLLECKYFIEERKKYLPIFYLRHVNTLKFQKLMSTKNLKLLKQLSRFISIVLPVN